MPVTLRPKFYWWLVLLGVVALFGALEFRHSTRATSPEAAAAKAPAAENGDVGCAGRIEAVNGLIRIAARDPSGGSAVIEGLGITEQQHLAPGQWVATLRGQALAQAALRLSDQKIATARLKLEQLRAAPKQAEFGSHTEEIERRQAEYDHARTELERYERLRKTEDVSASDLDARRATAEIARRSLAEAHQDRSALAESREPDAAVLLSGIREAEAERARLEAELRLYRIASPVAGTVLKVFVHAGESVGLSGIAEVIEDGPIYAIAEVTEADIFRVRLGQPASVKGELLPWEARGVVESIGRQVAGSEVLTSDPSAFTDRRIIPVKIRLSGVDPSRALIHARVSVVIRK